MVPHLVETVTDLGGVGNEVHGPDESRHERGGRPIVDLPGGAVLDEPALVDDQNPVGHGQGLFLVVGHHDGGHPEALLELADFAAQHDAHLGVQGRKGFIQKQQVG